MPESSKVARLKTMSIVWSCPDVETERIVDEVIDNLKEFVEVSEHELGLISGVKVEGFDVSLEYLSEALKGGLDVDPS